MKPFVVIVGILILLGALLAVSVLRRSRHSPPDCTEQIVIVKRPNGTRTECVCVQGALATCFNPGP